MLTEQIRLQQVLNQLPDFVVWKGLDNKYLGCNQQFADLIGLKNPDDIIGSTGTDYFDEKILSMFKELEQRVMNTRQPVDITHQEVFYERTGKTIMRAKMVPIFDENNEIESLLIIGYPGIPLSTMPTKDALSMITPENMDYLLMAPKYPITTEFGIVKLSRREAQCALYLLKGNTSREIAEQMDLSPKTVDNYIDNMKNKLGALSKSDLISTLINSDFLENF